MFWRDALDYMIDVQFEAAQRADAEIALVEPSDPAAHGELARMPGVMAVEGGATSGATGRGPRSYRTAIVGIPAGGELRRPLDAALNPIAIPAEGILLTDRLADRLGVRTGDTLWVEVLTGARNQREVPSPAPSAT